MPVADRISTVMTGPVELSYPSFFQPVPGWTPVVACFQEASYAAALNQARAVISDLLLLPADWDGYGANSVSPESAANAVSVIHAAMRNNEWVGQPEISPNTNGTISFEWEADGREAHIEIGRTRAAGYLRQQCGPPMMVEGHPNEVAVMIPSLLSMLFSPTATNSVLMSALQYQTPDDA